MRKYNQRPFTRFGFVLFLPDFVDVGFPNRYIAFVVGFAVGRFVIVAGLAYWMRVNVASEEFLSVKSRRMCVVLFVHTQTHTHNVHRSRIFVSTFHISIR